MIYLSEENVQLKEQLKLTKMALEEILEQPGLSKSSELLIDNEIKHIKKLL